MFNYAHDMSLLNFVLRVCLSSILSGPNLKPSYRLTMQVHILKQTSLIFPALIP